jgi:PEP-CTERM motif
MDQAVSKIHHDTSVASRLAKYTAAAGLGSFAFGQAAGAAITAVEASPWLLLSTVGDPTGPAPIEDAYYPGVFPFRSIGWATEGITFQYGGYQHATAAYGIDLDGNGTGDVNFFRGAGFGGYLLATSNIVGYYAGQIIGSGQAQFLSNSTDNPDGDGVPAGPGVANKPALQGFNAGEIIGDGNDVSIGSAEGTMREAGYPRDWDGVSDNYGNLYGSSGPTPTSSYVGFQISGLATGTGSGFGWVEVVVREDLPGGYVVPELQILRWAFTDDGSPIAAGDNGVSALVGDLDGDGFVGIADLNIVLGNWNQTVAPGDPLLGDPTGDGFVGIEDLNEVLGNWNAGTPPPPGAAVPEPTTLMLLTVGAGSAALRRRTRKV